MPISKVLRDLFRGRISKRIIAQVIKQIAKGIITNPVVIGVLGPFVPSPLGDGELTEEELEAATRRWQEHIATGGTYPDDPIITPEDVTEARREVLEQISDEERELEEADAINRAWEERFGTPPAETDDGDPFYQEVIRELIRNRGADVPEVVREILEEREAADAEQDAETERRISETERRIREMQQPPAPAPTPQPIPTPAPAPPGPIARGSQGRVGLFAGIGLGVLGLGLLARRGRRGRTYTTSTGAVIGGAPPRDDDLTPFNTRGVSFAPSSSSLSCPPQKRKRPMGKCLERAPVNWAGGRYRGKRAGTKCIRWKR